MRGLLVLLVALAAASAVNVPRGPCTSGEFKTDRKTRDVFRCSKAGKWTFHAKLLRPRDQKPMKALMSMKCKHNPDLKGAISGYVCDAERDMNVLDCLNTHVMYMCHAGEWHLYQMPPSGNK